VYNLRPIMIGDQSVVSHRATLCAVTHDYTKPTLPLQRPSIVIGDGVWVCTQAFIGPSVTVGQNSMVGACSVVM
jgi:putative colanic acid biosynthesis acetyltransferase WcaF